MIDCTECGTTFDPQRDTVGSGERCPSCGTDHPDATADTTADRDPRSDGGEQVLEVPAGTTVRITIQDFPGTGE